MRNNKELCKIVRDELFARKESGHNDFFYMCSQAFRLTKDLPLNTSGNKLSEEEYLAFVEFLFINRPKTNSYGYEIVDRDQAWFNGSEFEKRIDFLDKMIENENKKQ